MRLLIIMMYLGLLATVLYACQRKQGKHVAPGKIPGSVDMCTIIFRACFFS